MKKKSLFKNYLFNAAYSLLNIIMPIITIPYVSRILNAEGIGQVAYAQNIVSYFVLVASLGIPNYGIREIARCRDDERLRSRTFCEIFIINIIATIIASIMYYTCILSIPYFEKNRSLFLIVGIALILNIFNIDWFYKGIEEFKYITVRSYCVKIISFICIFLIVKNKEDINKYALILTLATTSNYIFNILHIKKYLYRFSGKLFFKKHFRAIIFLFATAVAVELYVQLDTTMLGILCGDAYVGYYSNSMRLVKIVIAAITAIGTVLLPRLSLYYQEGNINKLSKIVEKAIEYIIFLVIPCSLGIIIISNNIVKLFFGYSFEASILTMKILALLIPIVAIGNIFGTQLMIIFGLEKRLTFSVIIGAIVNLVLNSFFIKLFQQNGAAIASVISELIVLVIQIVLVRDYIKVKLRGKLIIKIFIQGFIMAIGIISISKFVTTTFISLCLQILVGIAIYFIVGFVMKNEIENEIWIEIKKKISNRPKRA